MAVGTARARARDSQAAACPARFSHATARKGCQAPPHSGAAARSGLSVCVAWRVSALPCSDGGPSVPSRCSRVANACKLPYLALSGACGAPSSLRHEARAQAAASGHCQVSYWCQGHQNHACLLPQVRFSHRAHPTRRGGGTHTHTPLARSRRAVRRCGAVASAARQGDGGVGLRWSRDVIMPHPDSATPLPRSHTSPWHRCTRLLPPTPQHAPHHWYVQRAALTTTGPSWSERIGTAATCGPPRQHCP